MERETIFTEEVDMLMEGKSVEEITAFMDENERTLKQNPFERGRKNKVIIPDEDVKKVTEEKEEKPQENPIEKADEPTETEEKK